VRWVRAHDAAGRVLALPSQSPGVLAISGLSRSQADASVWVLDRESARYRGAEACNRVLRELRTPWRRLADLAAIPGALPLEERCYAWFARNRSRFVRWGITPECERPGVACTPEGE
jgi:predicted DCC family thiol-disulfide oxidoreductase YuxK